MTNMKLETLWQGKFISIVSPKENPYESIHEPDVVLVIPIQKDKIGIRQELCPPYLIKDKSGEIKYYTCISGKIEEGESFEEAAIRELKEESGVEFKNPEIIKIFEDLPLCKSTDMRATCFVFQNRGDDYDIEKATGDGTEYEKKSKTVWVTKEELFEIIQNKKNIDALLFNSYLYITHYITEQNKKEGFLKENHGMIQKISSIGNGLFQLDNNDIFIDDVEVKGILQKSFQKNKKQIDELMEDLVKNDTIFLEGEQSNKPISAQADVGVVVDLYEVNYPHPDNPLKSTEQLAGNLDEESDFINQFVFPDTESEDVVVTLRNSLYDNHTKKNPREDSSLRSNVKKTSDMIYEKSTTFVSGWRNSSNTIFRCR